MGMEPTITLLTREQIESYIQFYFQQDTDDIVIYVDALAKELERFVNFTNPGHNFKIHPKDFELALLNTGFVVFLGKCNVLTKSAHNIVHYTNPFADTIIQARLNKDPLFCEFVSDSIRRFLQHEEHDSINSYVTKDRAFRIFNYEDMSFVMDYSDNKLTLLTFSP